MKIKSLIFISLMLLSFSANAQQTNLQQQFENELKSKNNNVTSIKCFFTQTREMSVLAKTVRKDGEFYYMQPSNLRLSFQDGDYIKMTPTMFEMKTGSNRSSTKVSSNPMLKNLSSILSACVVGDFEKMVRGFDINIEQSQQEWIITMIPQRGKAASKISRIVLNFDKKDMSLNILKMEEKSGDYTMYRFYDKKFNDSVDNNLFNIQQ